MILLFPFSFASQVWSPFESSRHLCISARVDHMSSFAPRASGGSPGTSSYPSPRQTTLSRAPPHNIQCTYHMPQSLTSTVHGGRVHASISTLCSGSLHFLSCGRHCRHHSSGRGTSPLPHFARSPNTSCWVSFLPGIWQLHRVKPVEVVYINYVLCAGWLKGHQRFGVWLSCCEPLGSWRWRNLLHRNDRILKTHCSGPCVAGINHLMMEVLL